MFNLETVNRPPLSKLEIIQALELLIQSGDPTTYLRIQCRTIHKFKKVGPFGAEYTSYNFRPGGQGNYLRSEGTASELLTQFRVVENGTRHPIHPVQGEVINAARIYTKGPSGIQIDIVRHPRID